MSAQQLADATASLGHPIARSVIANLESGRRDTVSVAELLVLARALDAPPLLLIFPIGREPAIEVLPGAAVSTWTAARWFTGEEPLPTGVPGGEWVDAQRWADSPAALFRDHDELVRRWVRANTSMARAATDEERTLAEDLRSSVAEQIRKHRALIRQEGLEPIDLPGPLRHVDARSEDDVDGER